MKGLLYNLLGFIAFGLAIYIVLLVAVGLTLSDRWKTNLNYSMPGIRFTYTRLREMDTVKNTDILILGTSHAYEGYDPRIFKQHNWNAANLGSTAQSFIQTALLTKRYIDRLKPKFVIFDVYPAVFSNDGVESGLDLISNASLKTDIYQMALKLNNIKVYNTLVYAIFMKAFGLKKDYKEPVRNKNGKYIKGGYVESYDKYKQLQQITKGPYKIHEDQLIAFKYVIQILKERKIPFVLIQAPMRSQKYQSVTNNDTMDLMISKYGNYYNFNKISKVPIEDFKDEHHLNQYGVNNFDNKLISLLGDTIRKACGK